jgi:hypothetical protein
MGTIAAALDTGDLVGNELQREPMEMPEEMPMEMPQEMPMEGQIPPEGMMPQ